MMEGDTLPTPPPLQPTTRHFTLRHLHFFQGIAKWFYFSCQAWRFEESHAQATQQNMTEGKKMSPSLPTPSEMDLLEAFISSRGDEDPDWRLQSAVETSPMGGDLRILHCYSHLVDDVHWTNPQHRMLRLLDDLGQPRLTGNRHVCISLKRSTGKLSTQTDVYQLGPICKLKTHSMHASKLKRQ